MAWCCMSIKYPLFLSLSPVMLWLFNDLNIFLTGCSDCVIVMHRVGEGLRAKLRQSQRPRRSSQSTHSVLEENGEEEEEEEKRIEEEEEEEEGWPSSDSAVNPFFSEATLWVEIDCGHFHRSRQDKQTDSLYVAVIYSG